MKTRYALDMLWVDPTATREDLIKELLPEAVPTPDGYLAAVATVRKRVVDRATNRRHTRDWRIGYFLMWEDGIGPIDLASAEARSIFSAAKAHGIDEISAFGSRCMIGADRLNFRQFGTRDLATLPAAQP